MINRDEVLENLSKGIIPVLDKGSLSSFITLYRELTATNTEWSETFLLAVEQYFHTHDLSKDISKFEDFFKLALYFDRDKNSINRFFDAVLGLKSLGTMTKNDQIVEETIPESNGIRISGSFEYSHTQTHYSLLIDIFNYLMPEENIQIIDIGSGFGRTGAFVGLCFPTVKFLGFEIVESRVECSRQVANRNGFNNIRYETQNVLETEFRLPHGDIYYFYDPLDEEYLEEIIQQLKASRERGAPPFKIVALGGYDDKILEVFNSQEWLKPIRNLEDEYFKQKGYIYQS